MSDKTITLVVSDKMYEAIQGAANFSGLSMSATVESKLSLMMFAVTNGMFSARSQDLVKYHQSQIPASVAGLAQNADVALKKGA